MKTRQVGKRNLAAYLGDLWTYRHLCLHLAKADIDSRFRRSAIGILWAMLLPLSFAVLYSLVLVNLMNQDFRETSIYVFSGIVMWEAISAFVTIGSQSIMNAGGYLRQSPIPILLFPIRTSLTIVAIAVFGIIALALYSGILQVMFGTVASFGLTWLWVAPILGALLMFGIPLATIFAIVNVKFRDTQQLIVVATQAVWFTSPVFFPRDIFDKAPLDVWSSISPVVAFLDVFRAAAVLGQVPDMADWIVIGLWTVVAWILAVTLLVTEGKRTVFYI